MDHSSRPSSHSRESSLSQRTQLPPFLPPTAQPPVQIPYGDPFQNRDPFLPASQHSRRGSHGPLGTQPSPFGSDKRWPADGGPPSTSSDPSRPANGPPSMSLQETARRRSVGAAGSPPRFLGGLDPPPPPSFSARNMPPPSPPSHQHSSLSSAPRGPPSSSLFNGARDLAGHSSRAGGGMSISSLIGETPRSANHSPRMTSAAGSPSSQAPAQYSPQRARSSSMRSEYRPPDRAFSPARSADRAQEAPRQFPYSSTSSQAHSGIASFRPYQSSPTSAVDDRAAVSRALERPSSQPTTASKRPEHDGRYRDVLSDPHRAAPFPSFRPFTEAPAQYESNQEADGRQRAISSTDARAYRYPSPEPLRPSLGRRSPGQAPPENMGLFRPAAMFSDHAARDPLDPRHAEPRRRSPSPSASIHARTKHLQDAEGHATPEPYLRPYASNEDMAQYRHSVESPLSQRRGRASPLPQAVQGAQSRYVGPGREPSIKNEFGRMFSGLGSGVGGSSTPTAGYAGNGSLTPARRSPARSIEAGPGVSELDFDGRARSNRKTGRPAEDMDRDDSDSAVDRNGTSGSKKTKTSHVGHHHHHHAHHHHHHHHSPAEDQSVRSNGPFHTLRFPSAGQSQPAAAHHHHHHHAVHAHHHHHAKPLPLLPPEISVINKEVLKSVEHLPRQHLGSMLYSSIVSQRSNKTMTVDTRFAFSGTGQAIPRFDGKENSTYTVRVPRGYLASPSTGRSEIVAGGLEQICNRRAVWGTGIYTDDSDVIAVAVHSGWLKGDFGYFNEDLRDLFEEDQRNGTGDQQKILVKKPERPVRISPDLDAHITVLILPPLTNYPASQMNFVHSRSWDAHHDGMSIMIHSIEFIDEPAATRYTERSGSARRQRMKEDLQRRKEAAEGLLGLKRGSAGVSVAG